MGFDPEHYQKKAIEAAKVLKYNLKEEFEDDPELLADMVEGETDLFEMADKLWCQMAQDVEKINGIEKRATDLDARKHRYKKRYDRRKALLEQAVGILEGKMSLPEVTLSLKKNPPVLVIDEESEIPSQFLKRQAPKLDRAGLKKHLNELRKEAEATGAEPPAVPGCHLEAAAPSLQVRKA